MTLGPDTRCSRRLNPIRLLSVLCCAALTAAVAPMAGVAAAADAGVRVGLSVVDAAGVARGGERVALVLLPTGEARPKDIPLGIPAVTTADGRATWTLRLTHAERAAVRANGDWLNLQAAALSPEGAPISFTAFSMYIGAERSQAAEAHARGATRLVVPDLAPISTSSEGGATAIGNAAIRPLAGSSCSNWHWKLVSTSRKWTEVGQLHTSADTIKAQFTYGRTADSNISVGYKYGAGPWNIGGSVHIGNTRSSASTKTAGSYYYRYELSQFLYGLWRLYADCYEGEVYQNQDHTEAITWIGGGQDGTSSISYWDNRDHSDYFYYDFGPGWDYARSTSDLSGISGAVSVFGASLSAQSGASSFVKYAYQFGSRAHHYLYGLTTYPDYAGVIYASDF